MRDDKRAGSSEKLADDLLFRNRGRFASLVRECEAHRGRLDVAEKMVGVRLTGFGSSAALLIA